MMKLLALMILAVAIPGCKKEHLQPDEIKAPLTWISARINNDSVYFAAGVDNYAASTFVNDVDVHRSFGTSIKSTVAGSGYFEVFVNNYRDSLADLSGDLENSFQPGLFDYEYQPLGTMLFTPGGVIINWYDSSGNVYSSAYTVQSNASFQIDTVETVVQDGLTYKKATVNFNCTLLDLTNYNFTEVTNGQAVLLFGGI
ncbi:MAG TPA: hypothetical protein VE978_06460 [Chitinophagales bacterium]|nr:hypothetical protein [Chitinophagales bacterium]